MYCIMIESFSIIKIRFCGIDAKILIFLITKVVRIIIIFLLKEGDIPKVWKEVGEMWI